MLAATRRWFRRNRTKFAVGAGTLGLAYLAGQYGWSKWLEARHRMSEERIAKENLRRRFEQNQEDCTYTVLALLPTVREEIIGALPVEEITSELQRQKSERLARSAGPSEVASTDFPSAPPSTIDDTSSFQTGSYVHASQMGESMVGAGDGRPRPKKSKVQLWYDMKINSIARALTLLYTLSLLTLLTRIQLNLLGRRTYLSSVVSLASPPAPTKTSQISLENNDDDNFDNVYGNDFETNRKYLTFSWWLLHKGCKDIMERVTTAVKEVFGPINPREDLTLERLGELILEVRKKVEGATETDRRETKWLPYLLPPKDDEDYVLRESGMAGEASSPQPTSDPLYDFPSDQPVVNLNPSLRRLLDETSDLIDSPTFTHVLTLLLNTAFSHLIDSRIASEAFKVPVNPAANDPMAPRITDITDFTSHKCKLAQTLAVFCRQAHVIAAGNGETDEAVVAGGQGMGNEYLTAIDQVKDLEAFAAVIYSSNFEFETVEEHNSRTAAASTTFEMIDMDLPPSSMPTVQPVAVPHPEEPPHAEVADVGQDSVMRSYVPTEQPTPVVAPVDEPPMESEDKVELSQTVLGESELVPEQGMVEAAAETIEKVQEEDQPAPESAAPVENDEITQDPVAVPSEDAEEPVTKAEEESKVEDGEKAERSGSFDDAWKKALAKEDGKA